MESGESYYDPKSRKDPTELKLYQPISLLPVLSKTFEKLLHCKILDFLSHDVLLEHQFGFWAHHSTSHQLDCVATTLF